MEPIYLACLLSPLISASLMEVDCLSDSKDSTVAFRLKPSDPPAHPDATNYTSVGVAQSIAYLDSGFIEPTQLAAIVKTAKDSLGQNTEERNGVRNSFLTV